MGRQRNDGNEKLGEHVQRRSGGTLELRFPIPEDVRHAFLDGSGKPRSQVIKSLGTTDVRLGNDKAEALRTKLKDDIRRVRTARSSDTLGDYLRSLFDTEMDRFKALIEEDEPKRRRATFAHVRANNTTPVTGFGERVAQALQALKDRPRDPAWATFERNHWGAALTSHDPAERRAAAGWAADGYFHFILGREPDPASPEYEAVLDQCISALVDSIVQQNDIDAGKLPSAPMSPALAPTPESSADGNTATREGGRKLLSAYLKEDYEPAIRQSGGFKGERTLSGKRLAVRLFGEIVGDRKVFLISKADLWEFHDQLLKLPDPRYLNATDRKLNALEQIAKADSGKITTGLLSPKTVNKHLTGIKTILDHAVKRRDIHSSVAGGVRAEVREEEDTGRPFTTDELNRIFQLPLFAGCQEGITAKGILKPGPVKVRDDRFWIPLVLFLSGARSSEIVGLATDEVFPDHDTPHFVIKANEFRSLKNLHSRRMVPIHPYLQRIGFLSFCRARVASGEKRFFPMAEQLHYRDGATGTTTKKSLSNSLIMRQFNRTQLAHARATDNDGSIKCFRNSFEQETLARVRSDEFRQRLTGRKVISTSRIYTHSIPEDRIQRAELLRALDDAMRMVAFPGVELTHLFVPDPDGQTVVEAPAA